MNPPSRNSFKAIEVFKNINSTVNFVNNSSNLQNDNQHNYTHEEYNLMRKGKLYLSALNRNCPRKNRKI